MIKKNGGGKNADKKAAGKVSTKRVASLGLFLAFSLLLGYVESLVSLSVGIPGIKLGLSNLAVVLVLYVYGGKEAFFINILRILLSGFLFGNLFSILYSLAGGVCSFFVMWTGKRTGYLGMYGVSMAGGVSHNIAQLAVAAWVVETGGIYYYMPPLLVAGVIMGMIIGALAARMYPVAKKIVEL